MTKEINLKMCTALVKYPLLKVGFKIIDTADFGIPQHRERVYIVGLLRDAMVLGFSFTWPTPQRRRALGTALGWRKKQTNSRRARGKHDF